tara:strand:+ start:7358 stop:7501 length:144 start_codon:yes stop_codon:yes gene_type:complete
MKITIANTLDKIANWCADRGFLKLTWLFATWAEKIDPKRILSSQNKR